ncbi:MAG: response regulator, partial [Lachnospiraceae bacterium]|nr:response regulator [Lachnospiraceae bacterium]
RDAVVSNNTSKSGYRELFHAPDAKILVVDDNKTNLDIVKKLLSRTEVQIDTALSANQCLMKCRDKQYDLIFMDHMMPEIDGVEAFRMLKNDSRGLNKDTKVIALTANAINGVREEYLEIGFVDYISKPIEPKLLEESIIKHLSKELVTIVSAD